MADNDDIKLTMKSRYRLSRFGEMRLVKKRAVQGLTFPMWDVRSKCAREDCPVFNICPYINETDYPNSTCSVEGEYLTHVGMLIHEMGAKGYMDQVQVHKAGILMIPLYRQLIKMKLVELGMDSVMISSVKENKDGSITHSKPGINPIYKEIRDIIKNISDMWKSIGIKNIPGQLDPAGPDSDNYYETLMSADGAYEPEPKSTSKRKNR